MDRDLVILFCREWGALCATEDHDERTYSNREVLGQEWFPISVGMFRDQDLVSAGLTRADLFEEAWDAYKTWDKY